MRAVPWKSQPSTFKELARRSLEGCSDRKLAAEFQLSPATVSRSLADPRIQELIGGEDYQRLKARRVGRIKTNLACPLRDADTGIEVGLFRQNSGYAAYGPRGRSSTDTRKRIHSLIRWGQPELESTVFALCQLDSSQSTFEARDFLAKSVERIEIVFARRGATSRDIGQFLVYATKMVERIRHRRTKENRTPEAFGLSSATRRVFRDLMKAVDEARGANPNSSSTLQLADATVRFFRLVDLSIPAWLHRVLNFDSSGSKVLSFREESSNRSIRILWKKEALMETDYVFADIEPDGEILAVCNGHFTGGSTLDQSLSRRIDATRREHLENLITPCN